MIIRAAGIDGTMSVMLKYGDESVIQWKYTVCELASEEGKVPAHWTKAIIVPIYTEKGKKMWEL